MDKDIDKQPSTIRRHFGIWREASRDFAVHQGMESAGNIAFLAMLSLFPFMIFLVTISGLAGQSESGIGAIQYLLTILPEEVGSALKGPIDNVVGAARADLAIGSVIFALWTAATGLEAARDILIRAFGRENARSKWRRQLESLVVIVIASILITIAMSTLVLGPPIVSAFKGLFPDSWGPEINSLWDYMRFLISPLLLLLGVYGLYLTLTPRRISKPYRLPGSVLTVLVLFATAAGLSIYIKSIGSYDVTYGSLAGIVVAQLFCFIIALGFIMGAEVNAAYTRASDGRPLRVDPPETSENTDLLGEEEND